MKKIKFLLIPVLFGMFLSSCGGSTPVVIKKASIKIEANEHMVTSLKEGEYELNKPIEFTVSSVNEEYRVTSVKMDNTELPPANNSNKYTFTPTEEKEYKLKVTTEELESVIIYTFNNLNPDSYIEQLNKKGVRLNVDNADSDFKDLFKNGNLNLKNNERIVFLFNTTEFAKRVLVNKVIFTFASGKEHLIFNKPSEKEEYVDGVYTYKSDVFDEDRADLLFITNGEVVISKIVVETVPYEPFKIRLQFNNLGNDDKVYFLNGPTFEEWEKKTEVTATSEFIALQSYYLYVAWGKDRKTYYDNLDIYYKENPLRIYTFYPSDESGLPKDQIVTYLITPMKEDSKINVLDLEWKAKPATDSIKVDVASANKYVKGFMETDPLASLDLIGLCYGSNASIYLRAKRGYMNLRVVVNGEIISKDEETEKYSFKVPFANPINISFSADEGDEERQGKEVITLSGDDKDKGVILGGFKEEQLYLFFLPDEYHPTASIDTLYFMGAKLTKHTSHDEEEGDKEYFVLSVEQTATYKEHEDKSSLFTATIVENGSYKSLLSFNKGAFKAEVVGKEVSEEDKYEVDGKSSVTVKITPNEFLDIHSVEVNDKRLTSEQYTLNPEDGSITYTFNANAKSYEFLIQTKAQTVKLELDEGSTKGYIIKDLPAEPVACGQAITLTLGVTDEAEYWLFGKKITVTYNGKETPVDENNFTFVIIPVKGVSKIKVIVEDKPLG